MNKVITFLEIPINKTTSGNPNIDNLSENTILVVEVVRQILLSDEKQINFLVTPFEKGFNSKQFFMGREELVIMVSLIGGSKAIIPSMQKEPTLSFFGFSTDKEIYLRVLECVVRDTQDNGSAIICRIIDDSFNKILLSKNEFLTKENEKLLLTIVELEKRNFDLKTEVLEKKILEPQQRKLNDKEQFYRS